MDSTKIVMIISVLFGVSEALAMIPQIKANSVFQLIANILKALAGMTKADSEAK